MRFVSRASVASLVASSLFVGLTACGGGPQSIGPSPVTTLAPATAAPATATPTPGATFTPLPMPSTGGGIPGTATPATAQPIVTPTPGATPTQAATLTPQGTPLPAGEKIYVVNHAVPQGNVTASNAQIPSVTVYPVAASGAATPLATLTGPSTGLDQAQFITVDANGTVYVTNQGTNLAGTLTAYPGGVLNGNVAPAATVTGLYQPEGVCVDDADKEIFVVTYYTVNVYREYAPGTGLVLDHQIAGNPAGASDPNLNKPQLFGDYGCFVNDGMLYIAGSEQFLAFKTSDTGNVFPTINNAGPATLLLSDLDIIADASGTIYLPNLNSNALSEFMNPMDTPTPGPTASASSTTLSPAGEPPTVTVPSTSFNEPFGISLDAGGQVYVTNIGNNTVDVFTSTTTFLTGVATTTISGTGTGLNRPYGIYAR